MIARLLILVVLLVLQLAVARADGKVFPPTLVPQEVSMPNQRALLTWHDGQEALVIESRFQGHGTDFAWIVPLPSKPDVSAATPGTLPSAALRPEILPGWDIPRELIGDAPGCYTLHHLPDNTWRLTYINHRGQEVVYPDSDYTL